MLRLCSRYASTCSKYITSNNITLTENDYIWGVAKALCLNDVNEVIEIKNHITPTIEHYSIAMSSIAEKNKDLHQGFWDNVYPVLKEQALLIDSNQSESLANFIYGFGAKAIQDDELWEKLEEKLYKFKNIHMYIEFPMLTKMLYGLVFARRGSKKTLDLLIDYLIAHKGDLTNGALLQLKDCLELTDYRRDDIMMLIEQ